MKNLKQVSNQALHEIQGGTFLKSYKIDNFTNLPIWDGIVPVPEQEYRLPFKIFSN